MPLQKKPVTGMKDILPKEMEIRDYCIRVIKETYGQFGFVSIETPCVESLENLSGRQGGDNEKLIFKILKRGEKLNVEAAHTEEEVADSGLRYDLTVPLARFYASHAAQLPSPLKALQIGNVWRADRPQRGRFRQFMQCDIDILGEPSDLAEIELLLAATTTFGKLGFRNFQVRINDRRILRAMAAYSGFAEAAYDSVFITLDKLDKLGLPGVEAELLENGFEKEAVRKYLELFQNLEVSDDSLSCLAEVLAGILDREVVQELREIMDSVSAVKTAEFELVFDAALVRGMSYYTGPIFEVTLPEFGGSCGGGGRYDQMVGRFTGRDVPACGFSIGFERIILLLSEKGFRPPVQPEKRAYLIEKGVGGEQLRRIIAQAGEERRGGTQILVSRMKKNKKFQKDQLRQEGYEDFREFYQDSPPS
jgi:histidyl-tRNA synthetase